MIKLTDVEERQLADTVERLRVRALFARMPSNIVALLLGVLLVFVFLLPSMPPQLLKAWAAFMLTTVAVRGWVWHLFRNSGEHQTNLGRWEWVYGGTMLLTATGWSAMCGPLFPDAIGLQYFIILLCIVVSYSGVIFASVSRIAFACFAIPIMTPAMFRYVQMNEATPLMAYTGISIFSLVLLMVHISLHRFALRQLREQSQAKALLTEQQAIFHTTTFGIVMLRDGAIVKCNSRVGEMLGRGMQALQGQRVAEFFADSKVGEAFVKRALTELDSGHSVNGIERFRRADGSEFWAEFSGRRMASPLDGQSVWTLTEAPVNQAKNAIARAAAYTDQQ